MYDGVPDYQCTIVATNRDYDNDGEDILGQGFFILEIQVQQVVYVTKVDGDSTALAQSIVKDIVEAGFNRGDGGRVRFRNMLQQHPSLSTVLNVEVIEQLSTPITPPSAPPSAAPSASPSLAPTTLAPATSSPSSAPSDRPTTARPTTPSPTISRTAPPTPPPSAAATAAPSVAPTTTATSTAPSGSPSLRSAAPTAIPKTAQTRPPLLPAATQAPTAAPPTTSTAEAGFNRQGLILGAIAGGVVTIVISLFFIFCVWFPICGSSKKNADEYDGEDEYDSQEDGDGRISGSRRHRPSSMSPSSPLRRGAVDSSSATGSREASIVPDVVQLLQSDSSSLADTTLDSRKHYRAAVTNSRLFDSFDESSIYTDGLNSNAGSSDRGGGLSASAASAAIVLPPSLSRALEYEEEIVYAPSGSATESSEGADVVVIGSSDAISSGDASVLVNSSSSGSPLDELDELVARSSESRKSPGSSPSSYFDSDTVESDENRAKEVSKSMSSGTKGFDPFAEDNTSGGSSAFDFDSSSVGETQEVARLYSADDRSTPSRSSSKTPRIKNLIIATSPGKNQRLISPTEEEKREVDEEIRDDPEGTIYEHPSAQHHETNNSLLRSVLEESSRMSKTTKSTRSRLSRKSAPSLVAEKKGTPKDVEPPHSLSADHHNLGGHLARNNQTPRKTKSSSKSVNAIFPLPRFRGGKEAVDGHVNTSREDVSSPNKSSFIEMRPNMRPYNYVPPKPRMQARSKAAAVDQTAGAQNLSTPETKRTNPQPVTPLSTEASPLGTLGAQPRDGEYESRNSQPDTPGSSPGVLGITVAPTKGGNTLSPDSSKKQSQDDASSESEGLSNPWLFDAIEQTLGPMSPSADMESISGRSNRSGKSLKSNRSSKSRQSHRTQRSYNSFMSAPTEKRRTSGLDRDQIIQSTVYSQSSTAAPIIDGSMGEQKSAEEPMTPRTLEYDLKRLEVQLGENLHPSDQTTTSSITASSAGASRSTLSSKRKTLRSKKKRLVIVVPPGRLGVVLADRHDGKGTVVSEVRASSAINGMLSPGDKLGMCPFDCSSLRDHNLIMVCRLLTLLRTILPQLPLMAKTCLD